MSEPFIGEIAIFAFGKPPSGYLPADGRTLNIQQYTALFSLIGNRYGGNGTTTFCLPNLNHGTVMGVNNADPDFALAHQGGAVTATLTANNTPAHTHSFEVSTETGTEHSPANSLFATLPVGNYEMYAAPSNPGVSCAPTSLTTTGGGAAFNTMSPYLGLQICICATQGLYPPRP